MSPIFFRPLFGLLLTVAVAAGVRADDAQSPTPKKDIDSKINASLLETIKIGIRLFNDESDDHGCYYLYRGAIIATIPHLEHRPNLKKTVEEKLAKSKDIKSFPDRAFALRNIIDEIRAEVRGDTPATVKKSLWERLGGETVVKKVVHDFVAAAGPDPKSNLSRDGKFKVEPAKVEQRLAEFISKVTDGPLKYTGKTMKEAHAGMKITEGEFNAVAGHFVAALKKNNVPQKEMAELISIFNSTKDDIVEVKPK